jgi:hypothetical protein
MDPRALARDLAGAFELSGPVREEYGAFTVTDASGGTQTFVESMVDSA